MEYQKITNLLGNIPDKVPKFITKKWIEAHDQSGNGDNRYKPSKQKHQCYNEIYVITVMHILFSKELLLLQIQMMTTHMTRN